MVGAWRAVAVVDRGAWERPRRIEDRLDSGNLPNGRMTKPHSMRPDFSPQNTFVETRMRPNGRTILTFTEGLKGNCFCHPWIQPAHEELHGYLLSTRGYLSSWSHRVRIYLSPPPAL